MRTVCKQNSCTGCMACVEKSKKETISIQDNLLAYNAVIDEGNCVGCGAWERVCPNNHKVNLTEPICWKEGWASNDARMKASSGGAASARMEAMLQRACLETENSFLT